MREETEFTPKPMLQIGRFPVILHLIGIFARQGFSEFVILGGYKANIIKEYFSNVYTYTSDIKVDLTKKGNPSIEHFNSISFLSGLKITVLDTGLETLTGERLLMARNEIGSERFIATYGDGLAPVRMEHLLESHQARGKLATLTVTRPENRFGIVKVGSEDEVLSFREKPRMEDFINIGFFIFEPGIWPMLRRGESLEEGLLVRLAEAKSISAFEHTGFWQPMDTYREYVQLNQLWDQGNAPWVDSE